MLCVKRFAVVSLRYSWKNVCNDLVKDRPWNSVSGTRTIHTSHVTNEFHEYDKRSGYDTGFEVAETRTERIRMGLKQLKKEIKMWKQEMAELLKSDPILDYRAGNGFVMKEC